MITVQYLMSEHFSDSISNRSARPEENTAQKKYLTRLLDHNNIDLLCDKESSLTDLRVLVTQGTSTQHIRTH